MTALRRVAIRSYRSIVRADLTLGDVTVVIGPSDSGKSNLVRALRDWAYNAPGTHFSTLGHSVTRIAVAVGDSHKVVFEKGTHGKRGKSKYLVVDGGTGEKVSYEQIGLTVPEEVRAVTGVEPVEIDDLSLRINFSEQAESWFLLANPPWTPGRVSKVVGRVSGVDALILASRDLVNKRIALRRESNSSRTRAEKIEEEAAGLSWIEKASRAAAKARAAMDELTVDRRRLAAALDLLKEFKEARGKASALQGFLVAARLAVGEAAEDLEEDLGALEEAEDVAEKMEAAKERARAAKRKAAEVQKDLRELADELRELAEDPGATCPACGGPAHEECRRALREQADGVEVPQTRKPKRRAKR